MRKIKLSLEIHQAELLVLLYFFAQPFGNSSLLPIAVMSFLGFGQLIQWKQIDGKIKTTIKHFLILGGCFFIPIILSLPDAINFNRTLSTVLTYPLYILTGLYLSLRLQQRSLADWFAPLLTVILMIWSCFSLIHLTESFGLFQNDDPTRAQGLFHNHKVLGTIMSATLIYITGYFTFKKKYLIN